MKKLTRSFILVVIWLGAVSSSQVYSNNHDLHKKHTRVGFHGMVLVTDGQHLFASHLPLYQTPHDYQLVYEVKSTHQKQLVEHLTQINNSISTHGAKNMITLLPARFDLNTLIEGQTFEIETEFYLGHFERGGKKWLKDKDFKFVRQIYKRPLANLPKTIGSNVRKWHVLHTCPNNQQLLIHLIQAAPSFDAIVSGSQCLDTYVMNPLESVPDTNTLHSEMKQCQSVDTLYFETKDFAK